MEGLRHLLTTWQDGRPRKCERAAFQKDVAALLELQPDRPSRLQPVGGASIRALADIADDFGRFLKQEAIRGMQGAGRNQPIVSPYAGGPR
eukprot:8067916-Pyramimonas_sp.AAC.1